MHIKHREILTLPLNLTCTERPVPTRPPPPPSLLSAASAAPPYKDVRSLARGLDVLKALNRAPGGRASTTDLAKACGVHRTTVKRLLETLRAGDLCATASAMGSTT